MFGVDDAIMIPAMTSAVGAGLSFLGGERRNTAQMDQVNAANAFSAQQFATRYQTTVEDMKAAGLNPALAYQQGGGSPPTGQQAQIQDTVTPAVDRFLASRANSAQVANIEADTENKHAQSELISAQAAAARASAQQSIASVGQVEATTKKILAEIPNVPLEGQRLRFVVQLMADQAALAAQQGETQVTVRKQLEAVAAKLKAETHLLDLDAEAAAKFDNMGRNMKELKPFFDILRTFIRR